ncbi:MAG TPA: hypothetical protein PLD52_09780 [Bacteroidales bacterium]|nr:hypothetical protein [Bacteroidales bacterium]
MIENNKLDKSFGPVGTSAGVILFVVGLILTFSHLTGLILMLIGAFVGFSSTSALIDYEKKQIKFSNNLFGIIKIGQWLSIEPDMKIGIKESNLTWRTYSMGNRTLDINNKDYRIILFDSGNKEIMQIKKTKLKESAIIDLETMRNRLGLRSI